MTTTKIFKNTFSDCWNKSNPLTTHNWTSSKNSVFMISK